MRHLHLHGKAPEERTSNLASQAGRKCRQTFLLLTWLVHLRGSRISPKVKSLEKKSQKAGPKPCRKSLADFLGQSFQYGKSKFLVEKSMKPYQKWAAAAFGRRRPTSGQVSLTFLPEIQTFRIENLGPKVGKTFSAEFWTGFLRLFLKTFDFW